MEEDKITKHAVCDITETFRKCWVTSTADNNLTLHGFRRFKTTHLINLRLLEDEIAKMDHIIYKAGLSLETALAPRDRLGLRYTKEKNSNENKPVSKIEELITPEFVTKLRSLLGEYDEALAAFNNVMRMETFSLIDDEKLSSFRDELSLHEKFKTRMVRIDTDGRSRTDPFQRWLHHLLRAFRLWQLEKLQSDQERGHGRGQKDGNDGGRWSYQNTILAAEIMGRLTTTLLSSVFLIVPLVVLSYTKSERARLVVISTCILVLSFLVIMFLRVSSFEMMAVAAAYAAVLSVFVSNAQEV